MTSGGTRSRQTGLARRLLRPFREELKTIVAEGVRESRTDRSERRDRTATGGDARASEEDADAGDESSEALDLLGHAAVAAVVFGAAYLARKQFSGKRRLRGQRHRSPPEGPPEGDPAAAGSRTAI